MHKPLATISQALLITTISLLVVWLPLSNNNVLINGIQTAKSFSFFQKHFSGRVVKVNSTAFDYLRNDKLLMPQGLNELMLFALAKNESMRLVYLTAYYFVRKIERIFVINTGSNNKKYQLNVSNTIGIGL